MTFSRHVGIYNKYNFVKLNCTINSTLTHVKMTLTFATNISVLQGKGYDSFINAIKSPKTKIAYAQLLRRYLNHRKLTEVDNLLLDQNPRDIESQIVDYVMTLRSEGIAYATICFLVAPVLTFYLDYYVISDDVNSEDELVVTISDASYLLAGDFPLVQENETSISTRSIGVSSATTIESKTYDKATGITTYNTLHSSLTIGDKTWNNMKSTLKTHDNGTGFLSLYAEE